MKPVVELGLVRKRVHASPVHSDYPVNWPLMLLQLEQFGFNPYTPEFAALIRSGKANRKQWRLMAPCVDLMLKWRVLLGRELTHQMNYLRLREADLRITRPRGAYDPAPI